ncbi:MAG: N-6 DNA methylase [Arenimonas sp.]
MGVIKLEGATYTPSGLALFVAQKMMCSATLPKSGRIRLLDPASGDGALLVAMLKTLPSSVLSRVDVIAIDTDETAIASTLERLKKCFPSVSVRAECRNFLHCHGPKHDLDGFHLIIANPPYVRTQIMGADQAQSLADQFGLTGRVDLYYAFLLAIADVLVPSGTAGVITSNRFLTTKSGQSVRKAILERFRVEHLWDMGDTKLFSAAVLPAVLIAHGRDSSSGAIPKFSTIYETNDIAVSDVADEISALEEPDGTVVSLPSGKRFHIRHGILDNGANPTGVWRIGTEASDIWLKKVEQNTWATFRTIGKIRVGVKSTADKVFLRSDWDQLPGGEPELLRPLITRKCAQRYRALVPKNVKHRKKILYPHEATPNGRAAVKLGNYPRAEAYLEKHREQLESRTYLIEAGRNWYELWVPQDPSAWSEPKLVFPDISEKPIFWMDNDGGVVNGECYWLRSENGSDPDLLWLALAVANSSFIEAFYDHKFNNKLYAGRRRFITQYVELFPLPDPVRQESIKIINDVKRLYDMTPSIEATYLANQIDNMIWSVFGLLIKK